MNTSGNASITRKGRVHLVRKIDRFGLRPAAEVAGLSPCKAREWHQRFAAEDVCGLIARSLRVHRSLAGSNVSKLERAVALRRSQRLTYARIAGRLGMPKNVVACACQTACVARLPLMQNAVSVRCHERKWVGELLRLDTKELRRSDKPGHRVACVRTKNGPCSGWQALHVAIDDHSRVGFSLVLTEAQAMSACSFPLAVP